MNHRRQNTDQESGYILLVVIFMVALLLIGLAVAAPRIAASIQRDRETELIHRGEQYKRAIKIYYKKFGHYPTSIDQLENTSNMRFLRKRYIDPMTGKDDWKIVHLGEAHVKIMGFFGQPISGGGLTSAAGSNPMGAGVGGSTIGTPIGGNSSTPYGSSSTTGSSSTDSSSSNSSSGTDTSSPTTGGTSPGIGGTSSSPAGTGTGTTGIGGSGFGSAGQSFGGAPMVGVVSKNTKASVKIYKLQKHYSEWEFVYDPLEDMMQSSSSLLGGGGSVGGTPGGPNNGFGTPGGTNPGSGMGSSPGSSGIGGSGIGSGSGSGFGSSPGSGSGGSFGSGSGFGSSPNSPQ